VIDSVTAIVSINGTKYTPTYSTNSTDFIFTYNHVYPFIPANTSLLVYWDYNVTMGSQIDIKNTTISNITLLQTPYNLTWDSLVFELENTTYFMQINMSDNSAIATAVLVWNGTEYPATGVNASNQFNFTVTVTMPAIEVNNTTINWNWKYNLSALGYDVSRNTTQFQTMIFAVYPTDIVWNPSQIIEGRTVYFTTTILDIFDIGETLNVTYQVFGLTGSGVYQSHSGSYSYFVFNVTAPFTNESIVNSTVNVSVQFNPTRIRSENISYFGAVITNCSAGSLSQTPTVTFYIRDEINRSLIIDDLDISLTLTDPDLTPFAFAFSNNSTYSLCIFPTDAYYPNATIELQYGADTYTNRIWRSVLNLNNVSQTIDLYLLKSTDGQSIIFRVLDLESGLFLDGLTIYIQRRYYDLGEAIFLTVATAITGGDQESGGKAFVDTTATYKFIVKRINDSIYEYSPMQITADPTVFVIGYPLFGTWVQVSNVLSGRCSFVDNNQTLRCTALMDDNSNFGTCLKTYDSGSISQTTLCDSCTTGLGVITQDCNVSNATRRIDYYFTYDYGGNTIVIVTGSRETVKKTPLLGKDDGMALLVVVGVLSTVGTMIHPILGMLLTVLGIAGLDSMNMFVMPYEATITLLLYVGLLTFFRMRSGG
jgi:hypothetical protein